MVSKTLSYMGHLILRTTVIEYKQGKDHIEDTEVQGC